MANDIVLQQVCPVLPGAVRRSIELMAPQQRSRLTEIRLRHGRPVCVGIDGADVFLCHDGSIAPGPMAACAHITADASIMAEAVRLVTGSSVYALERELTQGFVTLPGGHRVGLVGRAVLDGGRVRTQVDFGSLNYRVARSLPGVADAVMPTVLRRGLHDIRALVLSPPGDGKTTLLRDIARQLASGDGRTRPPMRVGVVDERSEIAACACGVPGHDVGFMCDVIDGCPKGEGIGMLIRSMAPQVIVTDEIGSDNDAAAIADSARCGVGIVASAHASGWVQALARPNLAAAVQAGAFHSCLVLSRQKGVVVCCEALDTESSRSLLRAPVPLIPGGK